MDERWSMRFGFALAWLLCAGLIAAPAWAQGGQEDEDVESSLSKIRLPEGFSISLFADDVPNARSLALGEKGTVFVGTRTDGRVFAVVDADRDGTADQVHTLAEGWMLPNGVAFKDGDLYVAEVHRVHRFDDVESHLTNPESKVIHDDLPKIRHHGWKFIAFGPDGWLYVPVGAPCNICKSEDPVFASILRMKPDGSEREVYAHGVRNTVGFDWHPETGALWFTDNGRDWMGDDLPPDELNRAPEKGLHFGYPYCHGGEYPDDSFDSKPCSEFTPPARNLGPHVAALGIDFYTGAMFPAEYRGQLFIAEHGSWNRSTPIGYRIQRVPVEGGEAKGYETFAEGWLGEDGKAWGRPVDVLEMPDGALLVSDDRAGVIYRITYEAPGATPPGEAR